MKRHHRSRRTRLTGPLIAVLVGSGLASVAAPTVAAAVSTVAVSSTRDVIANLFEWNWNSVANECATVLGPDGYGAVQVAPPQESISLPGNNPPHPWWEVYQPVSYQLTSRLGDRARFAAMVTTCHNAGVKGRRPAGRVRAGR